MLEVDVVRRIGAIEVKATIGAASGFTVVFGRSGAGKTSLANMIAGVLRPDAGRIVLDDVVLFDAAQGIDVPAHRRRIGYVYQDARLLPHLTVRHNLMFGWWFTARANRRVEVARVVDLLGLAPLLSRRPRQLSGGEKQRVAIGRALLQSPRLLIMDEPLASLDRPRRLEILGLLETVRHELSIPAIFVTHSVRELIRLGDVVVVMADGKVVGQGAVDEILGREDLRTMTGHAEAGAIVDTQVVAHDERYGLTTLEFRGGRLVLPGTSLRMGSPVRVRVRARDVAVAVREPVGISVQNVLQGTVVRLRGRGPVVDVEADVSGSILRARITRRAAEQLGLGVGQPVFLLIKAISLDRRRGR